MGLPNYIPERDAAAWQGAFYCLEMMVYNKRNFKQLVEDMEREFGRYDYLRLDYAMDAKKIDLNRIEGYGFCFRQESR